VAIGEVAAVADDAADQHPTARASYLYPADAVYDVQPQGQRPVVRRGRRRGRGRRRRARRCGGRLARHRAGCGRRRIGIAQRHLVPRRVGVAEGGVSADTAGAEQCDDDQSRGKPVRRTRRLSMPTGRPATGLAVAPGHPSSVSQPGSEKLLT
jgi:hypothetical protein